MSGHVESAVRALIDRVGGDAATVRIEILQEASSGSRIAGFEASEGVLTLRGSDASAAASAFARYLHSQGHRITWESPRPIRPLTPWPDADRTDVRTPFAIRYHLNVVTHGYSTPYWDWARWEQELDWMALHGVTHPLVLTGYEAVLAETLGLLGIDEAIARTWIGSAAHLPWMSMGGVHDFGGPLPSRWDERRLALARRIIARARELGMTPVLPLPGGHLPAAVTGDEAAEIEWQGWRTPMLDPASPAFAHMLRLFLETQRRLLGDPGPEPVFAVDPYIESLPPSTDSAQLAAAGAGVHTAITAIYPAATWLLQGWPFHYHRAFWTSDRVGAYLSRIPHERLLLIDLWGEHAPMWREGMHGRRWLWTAVHNFGGRFALFGDLCGLARDVAELRARHPERLEGIGVAPEAIENNTVFYELAADLVWDDVDVDAWLDDFAMQRYGVDDDAAREAWRLLGSTLYGRGRTRSIPSPVIARPWSAAAPFASQRLAGEALVAEPARMSANIDAENDPAVLGDLPSIARAASLLISLGTKTDSRDAQERDVVELTSHVLAQQTRLRIRGILRAFTDRDVSTLRREGARLHDDLLALDRLAATRRESRVSTWIAQARSWGDTHAEREVMERDARSLVSVWGHQSSGLHDYSGRHWSGLIRDLYARRWAAWVSWLADAVEHGTRPSEDDLRRVIVEIEEQWREAHGSDDGSDEDPLALAAQLLTRAGYA
ncbi:alpha-N-acetylglucosaminidase [Microbacterium sp. KSW4-16]|uniref:Alpha-N-acetylglucosaminidase n=1 Tax=Microbacterium aurugineum TaxID=2851642 RepID=A0ABY4IWV4_9MICO|nr:MULTISPECIES: alpha-N-acetylglucosaminidase [Microbacterium]MCK8467916.1 alpha-N-acetylglucosaminidase [Microbacterium aurugineum]TCJ22144.1 alpha-N-acetylglucosaminidase [Microbacterium sp. PI-1]UPL16326.1 alpha-N-acetylglucosaminidase [Microbacterium aurugineum]